VPDCMSLLRAMTLDVKSTSWTILETAATTAITSAMAKALFGWVLSLKEHVSQNLVHVDIVGRVYIRYPSQRRSTHAYAGH
jgi:hypothetical protein